MKRITILLALLFFLTGCGPAAPAGESLPETEAPTVQAATVPPETTAPETTAPETQPPQPERFTLTFAGDCTFGSQDATYYAPWGFVKTVGEDYGYPFRNVMDYFGTDDFTMVNLEGVLGDATGAVPKAHNLHGPGEFAAILTQGSVEAVTLANNYTRDYGDQGYADTKALLEAQGVSYVEGQSTLLHTTDQGLKIGIYAEEYTNMDMDRLKQSVAALRENGAEIVVYAVHWGGEYSYYPQPWQIDWAHQAVDAGVDILYGSHPHVLQYSEIYNGRPIFYSLGNFSFGGNMYPGDLDSVLVQVDVLRYPDGQVVLETARAVPVCISSLPDTDRNNFQPTPYPQGSEGFQRVLDKLNGLWKGR